MRHHLSVALFSGLLSVFASLPLNAEYHTLWEIGKSDQSSFEFHANPAEHILYRVGESDWTRDWPSQQRLGTSREIKFTLKDAPRGRFALRVSLLVRFANPDLQVEINGHRGLAFIRAQPLYSGDGGAWDDKTIILPTRYLVKGVNTLTLSSLVHKTPSGQTVTPGGPIRYDYLSLAQDATASYLSDDVQARVTPSMFYRRTESGELVEVVNVDLHF